MITYERDGVEVRTRLRRRLKLCAFEQLYRALVVTFLQEPVSEKKKHLRLGITSVPATSAQPNRVKSVPGQCRNQLVFHGIGEVVDAPYRIIPLPGLKQDNALNESTA